MAPFQSGRLLGNGGFRGYEQRSWRKDRFRPGECRSVGQTRLTGTASSRSGLSKRS
jgi:hypothetical protein